MSVSIRDIRRLLRLLGNPAALLRHPLARRIIQTLGSGSRTPSENGERVRAVIRGALKSIASYSGDFHTAEIRARAARIIELCDLEGCTHEDVIREIGLSRRQFYRDRSMGMELVAIELDSVLVGNPQRTASAAHRRFEFDIAETLIRTGRPVDAENILLRLCENTKEEDRTLSCALLVYSACESGDTNGVCKALALAKQYLPKGVASGVVGARLELALCDADELLGRRGARARRLRTLDRLRTMGDDTDERWETLASGLISHATSANARGDFETSLACLHEADALLHRCEEPSTALPAMIANMLGVTLMMMPSSLEAAMEQHRRAVQIARQRGLARIAVASTLNEFAIAMWRGRAHEVYDQALSALALGRITTTPEEYGRMALLVAKICLEAGQYDQARALLDEIGTPGGTLPRLRVRVSLLQTELYLQLQEFDKAAFCAEQALQFATDASERSLRGTALLLLAESRAGQSHEPAAREAFSAAIDHLVRYGSAHALERARRGFALLRSTSGTLKALVAK